MVIVPVLSLPVLEEVVDEFPVSLKQYKTSLLKSPLEKVTCLPLILVADVPIEGQVVAPLGRLVVEVVQFERVVEMVKSDGNSTITLLSVPSEADEGLAHTVPDNAALVCKESSLT